MCAVVENMAYFLCDGCDTKHLLFGDISPYRYERTYGSENQIEKTNNRTCAARGTV